MRLSYEDEETYFHAFSHDDAHMVSTNMDVTELSEIRDIIKEMISNRQVSLSEETTTIH